MAHRGLALRRILGWTATALLAATALSSDVSAREPWPRSSSFRVNFEALGDQRAPSVAMMPGEGGVIVFEVWDGFGHWQELHGQRFNHLGTFEGQEFLVSSHLDGYKRSPEAAMSGDGSFFVVWTGAGPAGYQDRLYGRMFDSHGVPTGVEIPIGDPQGGVQTGPAIAPDGSDGFLVVWTDQFADGHGTGILARGVDSSGLPVGSEFLVNSYTTGGQRGAAVAANATGEMVIVWVSDDQDLSETGIYGQRLGPGGILEGAEFQVNSYSTGSQRDPDVALASDGSFVIVWESWGQDGTSSWGVFGRQFSSNGTPRSGDFQISTYTSWHQGQPKVLLDDSGEFLVVYQADLTYVPNTRLERELVVRSFARDGSPLGSDLLMTTFQGSSTAPDLASLGPGFFLATWHSSGHASVPYFGDVIAQIWCGFDFDEDGLCNDGDIILMLPSQGDQLDCSDPRSSRPSFAWEPGNYERFKVHLAADMGFLKQTRVTSGKDFIKRTTWSPSKKKWRRACKKALAANPLNPVLYVRILGRDRDLPKGALYRKTFSQVIQVDLQF